MFIRTKLSLITPLFTYLSKGVSVVNDGVWLTSSSHGFNLWSKITSNLWENILIFASLLQGIP
jgi:hypothetical protein